MKIVLLFPDKIKPKVLSSVQDEYIKRVKRFNVDVTAYKAAPIKGNNSEVSKRLEGERILNFLKPGDYLVACDERGNAIRTDELSLVVEKALKNDAPFCGMKRIVIVIGGASGLAEDVRNRADVIWSLSSLVMAGGVARIVLLEGIYRAFTIVNNHPYHNI